MPETTSCSLCGADEAKPMFRLRDYRLMVHDLLWTAAHCRSCGLGYLNPRPVVEEIGRYYPASYFGRRRLQVERYQFRRWPLLALARTAVSTLERLVLADRIVRALRISGQTMVSLTKPAC